MKNTSLTVKSKSALLFSLLIALILLAACGEEKATSTPVSTVPAAKTTVATTSTTAATTTKAGLALEVAGANEIQTDGAFTGAVSKLLTGAQNLSIRLFVSGDSAEKLANNFDTNILSKGYSSLAGKPSKSGDSYVGLYSKTGAPDLILTTLQVPKDANQLSQGLNLPGVPEASVNGIYQQIKGKTAVAFILSGDDLVKAVFNAATAESTTTPAANQTVTPRVEVTAPATATPAVNPITNGPGSELVGTLVATPNVDVKVKKVERYNELKYEGKTIKPKGVFMVISFDYANVSKAPVSLVWLTLKDGQGREFDITTDTDVSSAISKMGYSSSFVVNPGFIGSEYQVYDVPQDAKGFKLEASFDTDRQPSPASFTANGGKGPDSGAGQELVGQTKTLESEKADIKIISVERVNPVKDGSKSYKSDGTFLIVIYEVTNNSDKPAISPLFYLQDSEGRAFSSTDNFDVTYAVAKNSKTKFDSSINPGQRGVAYRVFEVTKDATSFKPVELN